MPCVMSKDPTGTYDAKTTTAATPTVFVESDASPTASVVAATLNTKAMPVDANGRVSLSGFLPADNVLTLVIVGVQANDDVHLTEACPEGTTQRLKRKFAGAAPGGANPIIGFTIHAS